MLALFRRRVLALPLSTYNLLQILFGQLSFFVRPGRQIERRRKTIINTHIACSLFGWRVLVLVSTSRPTNDLHQIVFSQHRVLISIVDSYVISHHDILAIWLAGLGCLP